MRTLTIGMAHHTDFDGAYFTITHILQTVESLKQIELLVVDSSYGNGNPLSEAHVRDLRNFVKNCSRAFGLGARLIELSENEFFGTTQPRQKIFDDAMGDYVLCLDCHVLVVPHAIDFLLTKIDELVDDNLCSGPILNDAGKVMATHFDDVWRDEMWGIWALDSRGLHQDAAVESLPIAEQFKYLKLLPAFEIPAMGLGLFVAKRSSWLGFNPHFRGFGGEEFYIHTKYRQSGRKCLCLPFLRWSHRFGRPGGISYPITLHLKVRNYILGHKELGLPLDRVYEHFVKSGKLSEHDWEMLLNMPENQHPIKAVPATIRRQGDPVAQPNLASTAILQKQNLQLDTIEDLFKHCKSVERDLNRHMDTIREIASKCNHVTEFGSRRESLVAIVAAKPKKVVSFNTEHDEITAPNGVLHSLLAKENTEEVLATGTDKGITTLVHTIGTISTETEIEDTDMLFIDFSPHNYSTVKAVLDKFADKVKKFIVLHDTVLFGERGEGGDGINQALRELLSADKTWKVYKFDPNQYGLTVLTRDPAFYPDKEIIAWPPNEGPGTELKKILSSIGINPTESCDCNAKARQMDIWGVEGCEENFDTIVQWLREGKDRWGWTSKISAGLKLLFKDPILALKLDPADPFPGLVRAAIDRAKKQKNNKK
ncbi:MAG: hypothetical protein KatS3mg087_1177 [Patescibacteria group bacterium]|nr:MAG: hypothetical protein KatS3mg087_1177 [Patescibacteria group bacterium]